jgi:hypothetical protein
MPPVSMASAEVPRRSRIMSRRGDPFSTYATRAPSGEIAAADAVPEAVSRSTRTGGGDSALRTTTAPARSAAPAAIAAATAPRRTARGGAGRIERRAEDEMRPLSKSRRID